MPFLSEELWHRRGYQGSIALERYPQFNPKLANPEIEQYARVQQNIITETRAQRAERKIDRKTRLEGVTLTSHPVDVRWIADSTNTFYRVEPTPDQSGFSIQIAFPDDAVVSIDQRARLIKEIEQLEKVIANYRRQLDDDQVVRKMPDKVVANMRSKLGEYEAQLAKNHAALKIA
jgi:valyl-tRNA synthetase